MKKENLISFYERLAEKATTGKPVAMRGGISHLQGTITNPTDSKK